MELKMHLLPHRGTVSSLDQEEKLLFLLGQGHLLRCVEGPCRLPALAILCNQLLCRFGFICTDPKLIPNCRGGFAVRRLPVILAGNHCNSSRNLPQNPTRRTDRHAGEADTEDVGHICSLFDIFERLLSVNEVHTNVTRPVTLRAHSYFTSWTWWLRASTFFNVLTSITYPFSFNPTHPAWIILRIIFFVWTHFQGC